MRGERGVCVDGGRLFFSVAVGIGLLWARLARLASDESSGVSIHTSLTVARTSFAQSSSSLWMLRDCHLRNTICTRSERFRRRRLSHGRFHLTFPVWQCAHRYQTVPGYADARYRAHTRYQHTLRYISPDGIRQVSGWTVHQR